MQEAVFTAGVRSTPLESAWLAENIRQPSVRNATLEDVDALVNVELTAFRDVYGDPTPEVVESVKQSYQERVKLLDDLVSVLEDERGVYGLIASCTTDLTESDFLSGDLDMTDTATIQRIYAAAGKNAYVVNLAVLPDRAGRNDVPYLIASALAKGHELGVAVAYFVSRIPGFDAWQKARATGTEAGFLSTASTDELANTYWQATQRNGKPLDPLIRMYSDLGARPLRLVSDAWKPDRSSGGYGVMFEYRFPQAQSKEEVSE